jgi:hypothetical protein
MRSFKDTPFSFGGDIPKDPWTLGAVTQSIETAMIHAGNAYRLSGTFAANGTAKPVIAMTPPKLAAATVTVDMTNANADMTYTAATKGEAGNAIRVIHTAPDVASSPLSIRVDGVQITISLATNGAKAVTTTALALAAAINADSSAKELIVATYEGTGLGVVNADAGTANALTGGTENVYCFFKIGQLGADAEKVVVNVYEGATFTGTAATFKPINRNRIIASNSLIPFSGTLSSTVTTTNAVKIAEITLPASAAGVNIKPVTVIDESEWVLCPGKQYVIEFVPAGATAIDYSFFGYEVTGESWQS